ncbi:MAG: hypothetical protein CM1200mP4_0650 [Rhodospirillaceae bacterium]|nr:MAG: hypothetical protein CM1200mP4_0650 [Rhodospirillaceae bacterium]
MDQIRLCFPAVNGMPWWYFYKLGGVFDGHQMQSVDPGGEQWKVNRARTLLLAAWYTQRRKLLSQVLSAIFQSTVFQLGNQMVLGRIGFWP